MVPAQFGDSSSAVTANSVGAVIGTIDLNGNTQEAGKNFVVNGGSLVNNSGTAVTIHTGASANHATTGTNTSGLVWGAGTDTGSPAGAGAWSMDGGTVPTVAFTGGGGSGATGEVKMQVGWMRLNVAAAGGAIGATGSGYLKAPTVTFSAPSDPNGRTAKAFLQIGQPGTATAGQVTGIQIVDPGWGYTSVPTLTIDNTGTSGTGFRPVFAMAVNEVEITSAGSGYTSAPTVSIANLGVVSGTVNPSVTVASSAPVLTGGFGGVTLNAPATNSIGGSGDILIPAAVTGVGGFNKIGAGNVTLGAVNTYAGNTTVQQGALILASGTSINSTPVIKVDAGATLDVTALSGGLPLSLAQTLKGNGQVLGDVVALGTIAPGASVGTLTVSNDVTFGATGTFAVEYDENGAQKVDLLAIGGDLALNSGSTISFIDISSPTTALSGIQHILATYTGVLSGTFSTVVGLPAGYVLDYGSGSNSFISINAVPEAGAFLAGCVVSLLVGAGVTLRRRKK